MLLVTGEARFADLIERTLYNGFLSGLSLDGRSFFYVNPLQSRGGHARATWNPVACCPPNIMRLLASLDHYLATSSDDGVQLHQYTSSTIRLARPDGPVELRVETAYPVEGRVEVEMVEARTRNGHWRCGFPRGRAARPSTASRSRRVVTPSADRNYPQLPFVGQIDLIGTNLFRSQQLW